MQVNPAIKLPFLTLLLMISFASVNAVIFTPSMPEIAQSFSISDGIAQQLITWFLIGYAIGPLIYGPLANRFGRKSAIYMGIILQICASLLCILSAYLHVFILLIVGRCLLALGSCVGLKMTFTLVSETYDAKRASQCLAYLMLAFAITPALSIALGGYLTALFGWVSTFYACGLYGIILLILSLRLPETKPIFDKNALRFGHLLSSYLSVFKQKQLLIGSLIMSCSTCFIYIFAAQAPFIAINIFGMNSEQYGLASLLPPIGLVLGSLLVGQLVKYMSLYMLILLGIISALCGSVIMFFCVVWKLPAIVTLFIPMILSYLGSAFIFSNASTLAMQGVTDKAHGSAAMNFLNMGIVTLVVLSLSLFETNAIIMPMVYIMLSCCMFLLIYAFKRMSSVPS